MLERTSRNTGLQDKNQTLGNKLSLGVLRFEKLVIFRSFSPFLSPPVISLPHTQSPPVMRPGYLELLGDNPRLRETADKTQ